MLQILALYLCVSIVLAVIVALALAIAPKQSRAELAAWGAAFAVFWFFFIAALVADELIGRSIRLARRVKAR